MQRLYSRPSFACPPWSWLAFACGALWLVPSVGRGLAGWILWAAIGAVAARIALLMVGE